MAASAEKTANVLFRPGGTPVAVRNMAWLLGDKALALLVGLAVFGLIGRTLGPTGAGHFAYSTALLQTGLGLSLVCAGVALLPRFCRINGALPGAIANVFVLRIFASLIAMLVMMVFCIATVDDPQRRTIALILLLAVPLIEPFYVIATYWLSRNENRPTVIARSSGLLVRAAIVVAGLHFGAPVWALAAAWVVEAAINASLQSGQLRVAFQGKKLARFVRAGRMRAYLGFGLRFVLALWLAQLFLRLDRLALAEALNPHDYGIYATAMQLVEVWAQVAYLIGTSIATAYLYRRLGDGQIVRAFLTTAAAMLGIGLLGLLGAWLLGPLLLRLVFGPEFAASHSFLVAGAAFAALLFADQAVDMLITAQNQPQILALKWGVALLVAAIVFWEGFDYLGAYVGPVGLASGLVAGWATLFLPPPVRRRFTQGRTRTTGKNSSKPEASAPDPTQETGDFRASESAQALKPMA